MKKILFLILAFCLCVNVLGQKTTIKGKVTDKQNNEVLMFANCLLHYQTDTVGIYKGIATDTSGCFVFKNVKKRDLILEIQYIGFKTFKTKIPESLFKSSVIDLGTIYLEPDNNLSEVTITAKKKRIEVSDDKLIVNIDDGMANMVSNAFDLLRLVPGVVIDNDDNLQLNGKSGAGFQNNGRDLKMDWDGVKNMLKSMPAELIESYEVLTNPGVKYDADGTAGIINIRTKKNQHYGINGSVSMNARYANEYTYDFRPSGYLNFINDKWTISGNYSFNKNYMGQAAKKDSTIRYMWTGGDTTLFRNISEKQQNESYGNYVNFSASYGIDSLSSASFYANYSDGHSPDYTLTTPYQISHNPDYYLPDSSYTGLSSSRSKNHNLGLGLSYVRKLDSLDSKISSDLDFSLDKSDENYGAQTTYLSYDHTDGSYTPLRISSSRTEGDRRQTDNESKTLTWCADYFKPINDRIRFEMGLKTKFYFSNNDYNSFLLQDSAYINNPLETNDFKYFENINSFYASITDKFFDKKLSLRLGIRLEQTNTKGEQTAMDSVDKKHYFNIFPNVRLGYKFTPDNELSLAYSYRIWRPWSSSLNPFISRQSDYYYESGNPLLAPEYSHSLSLTHSFKYMIFTSLRYSYSKDDINYLKTPMDESYTFEHSPLAVIDKPQNLGHTQAFSFNVTFSKNLFESLYFSLNGSLRYNKTETSSSQEKIERENLGYNISANAYTTLPYKIKLSAFYMFSSAGTWGISKNNGFQWFSLNVGKDFLDDRLSANLSCQWGLGKKGYYETRYGNMLQKTWRCANPPSVRASVSWKFGKFYQNKTIQKHQTEDFDDRKSGAMSS